MSCYSQVSSRLRCFSRFLVLGCDRTGAAVAYTQKSTGYHPTDQPAASQVHHLWIGEHGAFRTDHLFCTFPNWRKKTSQPSSLYSVSSVYAAKKYGLEYMTSPWHAKNVKISTSILFAFEKVAPKIPKRWYALIGWPEKDNQGDRLMWTKLYLFSWWFLNSYRHELSEYVWLY